MPYLSKNIVNYEDQLYEIVDIIYQHNFLNKDGHLNKKVLGMYVDYKQADRVLSKENKFLICKLIEEAQIIE